MKIKKIALVALILAFVMSCPNNEDITINLVQKDLIFCGEELETRDSVTYIVKKYAELTLADCPYFYNYYKIYYLNDKIRRLEVFYHGLGCEMDCKYTEFVEHQCFELYSAWDYYLKVEEKYEFYEDGKKSSYFYLYQGTAEEHHYAENGNLVLYRRFWVDLYNNLYNVDYNKWSERKYDDYGREEYILKSIDGVKQLEGHYTYYSNGKCKAEKYDIESGNLSQISMSGVFYVQYDTSNNSVRQFYWNHPDNTSRTQYYYNAASSILTTYDENGAVIEGKAYTDEEIQVFIQALIDDYIKGLEEQ